MRAREPTDDPGRDWPPSLAITVAACGGERSYDNPPEVPIGTASSTLDVDGADHHGVRADARRRRRCRHRRTRHRRPQRPDVRRRRRRRRRSRRFRRRRFRPRASGTRSSRATRCSGSPQSSTSGLPDLLSANGLNENSLIVPGQQLNVPQGGSVPATQPTQPPPSTAPPAGTAAPPAATAAPPAAPLQRRRADPAPTAAGRGRRRRLPRRPVASSRGRRRRSCQAPDSEEADGTPIVFAPGNVLDHNPATAWRCEASATGQTLTFTFDGRPTSRRSG